MIGISVHPESCGIFPEIGDGPEMSPEDLSIGPAQFGNSAGLGGDPAAVDEVLHHIQQGHIMAFDTYDQLKTFVGGTPVLNKIGIIVRTKAGVTKRRMILDTMQPGVKGLAAKHQRVMLPRLLDAIIQSLSLLDQCERNEAVSWFVLDFTEAHWQTPLHESERKYFCARLEINGKQ